MRRSMAEQVFDLERLAALHEQLVEARVDVEEVRRRFLAALVEARKGGLTQPAIGERLGISKQRVGQLELLGRIGSE